MPKGKKKLLPKDFDARLKDGDIAALKAVFDTCELDARGGYPKQTALAFVDCPDELARWLVAQGLDTEARDTYGRTPLHEHAADVWGGRVDLLLDLGADIHAVDKELDTPLHKAAKFGNAEGARVLLDRGARADALNAARLTPLAAGLQFCTNAQIEATAGIAEMLLAAAPPKKAGLGERLRSAFSGGRHAGAPGEAQLKASVQRIGENFEFHRAGFNPDFLDATSDALDRLYALFGVPPVPRRLMHDGRAPIVARSARWQDQQQELWALLVPSSGAAATVQGEVIRIAGRIADELDRNGGGNWDADYRKMGQAFLAHVASGSPLPDAERDHAASLIAEALKRDDVGGELCRLAVEWIRLNPTPVPLGAPDYGR